MPNVRYRLPPQPVNATQALNLSADVSNSSVLRGLVQECNNVGVKLQVHDECLPPILQKIQDTHKVIHLQYFPNTFNVWSMGIPILGCREKIIGGSIKEPINDIYQRRTRCR